jgi:hypothetical protein
LSLCATAHPLHTGFTNIIGTSISETRQRDRTLGKTSGRSDDNSESLRKRYKTYEDETRPVLEHFGRTPGLVEKVWGLDEGLSSLSLPILVYMENPYR